MSKETFSGGCQCGQVRYKICQETLIAYACHCIECQRQTASAFALSVPIELDAFCVDGSLTAYDRPAHSGATTKCHFCSNCGTRIYHQSSASSELITLKGGTLDDASNLLPVAHLWILRAHKWIELPTDAETYERQPTDLSGWRNKLLGIE